MKNGVFMRKLLRSAAMAIATLSTPAFAQDAPVVVELYTSQGCSSCPPADAILAQLATRDDVIALALHVDYWDYIGWADDFADPNHTRRQQDYARAAGETTIYTPQFVIAGRDIVVGAKGMKIAELIQAHSARVLPVAVSLVRDGAVLTISAKPLETDGQGPYVVQLVRIMEAHTVDIRRGENAGRSITYSNIVQSLDTLQQWDGSAPVTLQAEVGDVDQVAVIIQAGTNGPVVGAAKLR